MTPNAENNQKTNFELEDALHTFPVVSAPAGFSRMVMDNVRVYISVPQFRLSWIDYALMFFVTSMAGLALVLRQFIPMQRFMLARFQLIVLWEHGLHFPFTPILFVGLTIVFVAMFFGIGLFNRPRLTITSQ